MFTDFSALVLLASECPPKRRPSAACTRAPPRTRTLRSSGSVRCPAPPHTGSPGLTERGSEFHDADTLTTSEARLLVDVVLQQRRRDGGDEIPVTECVCLETDGANGAG